MKNIDISFENGKMSIDSKSDLYEALEKHPLNKANMKKDPLLLMDNINAHFKSKQTPQRFTYLLVDNTMVISRRYPVAIFLIQEKKLYRIYGSLHLQWNMVKGAIKKFVKDITIIE